MKIDRPKIRIIFEDSKGLDHLQEGFGFSCLIEWDNQKILFDTGGCHAAFFKNCEKLQIDLKSISLLAFSHHHFDHTAAFDKVLGHLTQNTPILIPKSFSLPKSRVDYSKFNIKIVTSFSQIAHNVYSIVLKGKWLLGGFFLYEQSLILDTEKGLVVVTGCAHPGIISILQAVQEKLPGKKIHLVLGGFHLKRSFSSTQLKIIKQFQELQVEKVAPCHCAGDFAINQFKEAYSDNFVKVATGTLLEV